MVESVTTTRSSIEFSFQEQMWSWEVRVKKMENSTEGSVLPMHSGGEDWTLNQALAFHMVDESTQLERTKLSRCNATYSPDNALSCPIDRAAIVTVE
jgi:hypothetical protein